MVEFDSVCKRYGKNMVLHDMSFHVNIGSVCGLLGPNGAGKSTIMNIMCGCLSPSSGTVKIGGYNIVSESKDAKRRIGFLAERPPISLTLTPYENLRFVAQCRGIKKSDIEAEIQRVMSLTQIEEVKNRICKNLSKGYGQRVGLAMALIGNPELIVLDEPTVGLDPKQAMKFRQLIKALAGDHTIIISSHILSDIKAVCDSVIIISDGKIVAQKGISSLEYSEDLEDLFLKLTDEDDNPPIQEIGYESCI